MPSLSELRTKINSIKSTQQITKAMKMIASVRLAHAQKNLLSVRNFLMKKETMLFSLLANFQDAANPLLAQNDSDTIGILVVVGDKGLCGGFNNNALHQCIKFMEGNPGKKFKIFVVGKKGQDFFPRMNISVEKEYPNIFSSLKFLDAKNIAAELLNCYLANKASSFIAIYNESKSIIKQRVLQTQILPVQSNKKDLEKFTGIFIFEPNNKALLDACLLSYFSDTVYRVLMESYVSELAARMTAMDNASKNAQDLIDSCTLTMNNVRQSNITRELSEIVGASEALK